MGLNLIGRSIGVGDRSCSSISVPHAGVDVAIPVRHLSLPEFSPVLELSIKDVSVPMAHDALPTKPASGSCHRWDHSSPAVDEVSFVFVQGTIEEDALAIELSSVKEAFIPVKRVFIEQ